MALNLVTLTGTIPGGEGALVTATLSGWQPDSTDEEMLPPKPDPVTADLSGYFEIPGLAANDNPDIPVGSYYTVAIDGIAGVPPYQQSYVLNYEDGPTQDISQLTPMQAS